MPLNDYLLFIDTEASGLPEKWHLPYSVPCNWPFAVQVAWVIYSKDGKKVREQNHYINNDDVEICAAALNIHGLTQKFLALNGICRSELLAILTKDLQQYQPMIIGHFMELDYHILGAEYYRESMKNPMEELPTFCIMLATRHLQQNPRNKYLRLGALYELLFKKPLLGQHNAIADAAATADCFFELVQRNELKTFTQPPIVIQPEPKLDGSIGWIIALIAIVTAAILIFYYG